MYGVFATRMCYTHMHVLCTHCAEYPVRGSSSPDSIHTACAAYYTCFGELLAITVFLVRC